jgi:hypothetical protein
VPPLGVDVKFNVKPEHTGLLLPAVILGVGLTTTAVLVVAEHKFTSVIVTVYAPA